MEKIILGIETSCDDTSLCILEENLNGFPKVLFFKTYGQEEILKSWGGVVPEIAARNHLEKINPLIEEAFFETKLDPKDLSAIGVTTNPGLLGPLLTGLNAAKTISLVSKTPIIPVNHLYAHLEAIHLTETITYPYLGILVSGGHTLFMFVSSSCEFEILGSTIDDAAGEAFDKGGKLLGLGYPAGKIINDLSSFGDKDKYSFPIGLKSSNDTRMSFSGIKTSLRVHLEKYSNLKVPEELDKKDTRFQDFYDTVASYQEGIVDNIVFKFKYVLKRLKENNINSSLPIVLGGGVASNTRLREKLKEKYKNVYFVKPSYCTDNGVMIANFALRNLSKKINYPETLYLDAKSRFINKKAL